MQLPEKQRELLVPNIGYALTPTDATNVKQGDEALQSALSSLNTMRDLRKSVGVESYNSPEDAAVKAAATDFL